MIADERESRERADKRGRLQYLGLCSWFALALTSSIGKPFYIAAAWAPLAGPKSKLQAVVFLLNLIVMLWIRVIIVYGNHDPLPLGGWLFPGCGCYWLVGAYLLAIFVFRAAATRMKRSSERSLG